MQVFISHHIGKDEKLALMLKENLERRGIDGYIAQRKQQYEVLIIDKIKEQIELSDYLVAIITKYGLSSASVHEEIGYAMALDIPVVLMVEEEVEERGVLIHGKEPFYFERSYFDTESAEVAIYIKTKGVPKRRKKTSVVRKPEIDQYGKYGWQERYRHLRDDAIDAFNEHGFSHRFVKITKDDGNYKLTQEIDILENRKRKHRFYMFVYPESISDTALVSIYREVRNFVFPSIKAKRAWTEMCFILSSGSTNKVTVERYYEKQRRLVGTVSQNTTIQLENGIVYYGLGSIGRISNQGFEHWDFPSSLPKFFVLKVKSKRDISRRIGDVFSFIEGHNEIFKNVPKLKGWQEQHRPSGFQWVLKETLIK